jgi:hypothetical protein
MSGMSKKNKWMTALAIAAAGAATGGFGIPAALGAMGGTAAGGTAAGAIGGAELGGLGMMEAAGAGSADIGMGAAAAPVGIGGQASILGGNIATQLGVPAGMGQGLLGMSGGDVLKGMSMANGALNQNSPPPVQMGGGGQAPGMAQQPQQSNAQILGLSQQPTQTQAMREDERRRLYGLGGYIGGA